MKNMSRSFLIYLISLVLCSCNNASPNSEQSLEKIRVGAGPEDMVLDTIQGNPRLIISCSARREEHKPYGEMVALDLRSGDQLVLTRYNEPREIRFHPHGIYLDRDILYVISHEKDPGYHPILAYRLHGDSLEFKDLIHCEHQHSPNALVTGPGGEIYFVNDSGKRGSLAEKIFKLKRASVVRVEKDRDGTWSAEVVATGLGYPAGINRIGNKLYAGDAILHRIHVFTISGKELIPEDALEELKGNDNIRIHRGQLLVPGHVKPFRFIGHSKDSEKLSPVEVFLTDPATGNTSVLYSTDGSSISAGSSSIVFANYLYISQVFDPFILKVPLLSEP